VRLPRVGEPSMTLDERPRGGTRTKLELEVAQGECDWTSVSLETSLVPGLARGRLLLEPPRSDAQLFDHLDCS
jgi:hypothetical protein